MKMTSSEDGHVVRDAAPADVDAIMDIESTGISHPWDRDSIEALINNVNKEALVVSTEGGQTVGYIGASYVLDEAEIGNICIYPEYRGKGLGRELLLSLESSLKAQGVHKIFLEVEAQNTGAIALYEHSGYQRYNVRSDYYGKGRDAILYVKNV